jgi:hypothetical protein
MRFAPGSVQVLPPSHERNTPTAVAAKTDVFAVGCEGRDGATRLCREALPTHSTQG